MAQKKSPRQTTRRRGAVIHFVALSLTMMVAFAALTLDLGKLYVGKAELQRAADAAALAAAQDLMLPLSDDPSQVAFGSADALARKNAVLGKTAGLGSAVDIEFGEARIDSVTERIEFHSVNSVDLANAARVTLHRTEGSEGGAIPLAFAGAFTRSTHGISATATAAVVPRDIAVVIDLSGSMNDDSELQHSVDYRGVDGSMHPGVDINNRDVWAALDGPEPSFPYVNGEYDSDNGPTIGVMSDWGDRVYASGYDPSSDPGLWYVPKGSSCTEVDARSSLAGRGYDSREIDVLCGSTNNNTEWRNRVGVILGLAEWTPSGSTDTSVGELSWIGYPSFRKSWTWAKFIDFVGKSNSSMAGANGDYRYRFGLKTFVNFLLENQSAFSQTELFHTPEQPLRAVKDAVQTLTNVTGTVDNMSLEIFATTARHEVDLTNQRQGVSDRLYAMQSSHYDNRTNIGGGIDQAIAELTGGNARASARKIIVLMSDGAPNIDANGNAVSTGSGAAWNHAVDAAQRAADEGIRIYTVSVGDNLDRTLMQEIAAVGRGEEFHAGGTPEEYTEELQRIFKTIGGRREIMLIE